jgi:hypothetical protein
MTRLGFVPNLKYLPPMETPNPYAPPAIPTIPATDDISR